ncbi:MAG: tRNA 2-thiocytidine biosynthesis TtcA family protein [Paludibacteraceae bacterium]
MELFEQIQRKVNAALKEYALLSDGDKVLIGLSGGKDSLALVEFLGERAKIYKPRFTLVAAHISVDNVPYQADLAYLEAFCGQYNVPFVHRRTHFDTSTDARKSHCFLCSWNRRKMLFALADELGCNKIALGHHRDDMLETLLMNQIFQGTFASMPPKLTMDKFAMTIIRPLANVRERDLQLLAEQRCYRKQVKNCPYECESNRSEVRRLLEDMERLNPHAASSLWNSMRHIQTQYLPTEHKKNDRMA